MTDSHLITSQAGVAMSAWQSYFQPEDSARDVRVDVQGELHCDGWLVRHIDLGDQPHSVGGQFAHHTLLIYDPTCYLNGERSMDGRLVRTSGPIGDRMDFVPAGVAFTASAHPGSRAAVTILAIDAQGDGEADEECRMLAARLHPVLGIGNPLVSEIAVRLRRTIRNPYLAHSADYVRSVATVLLHEIADEMHLATGRTRTTGPAGGLSARAQRVVQTYIQSNLGKPVDLETLAAVAGLSRFHFARAFRKSFGVPPGRYVMQMRIAEAARRLHTTCSPITDVALDLGFSTPGEFSRAFRLAMNCSPREFRGRQ
ncbi:Regulatory protein SoxS [compost metagenome]